MNAIEVKNLSKSYRMRGVAPPSLLSAASRVFRKKNKACFKALDDVSFAIEKGKTIGVIGPNGSGKSSLLGLVAGTIFPTQGEVVTHGRLACLLELGAGFHPELTGRENVFLNASILGISKERIEEKFEKICDFAELGDFINMPVKTYSSGMYVRLGFAIAVEMDPDILLIDEVLAVGDVSFQFKCLDRIRDFQRKGKTILFVSHSLRTIEDFCDEAFLIYDGKLAEAGPPQDVIIKYLESYLGEKGGILTAEYGTREVELTKVVLRQNDEAEVDHFLSGKPMHVDIHYDAKKKIERPVFGFSLKTRDGLHIYGSNTQLMNSPLDAIEGKGMIRLSIDRLPLIGGKFFLSVSTHSWDHATQYHRREDWYPFTVENKLKDEGYVRIDGVWSVPATSNANR